MPQTQLSGPPWGPHCIITLYRVFIYSRPHLTFSSLWMRLLELGKTVLSGLVPTHMHAHTPCPRRLEGQDTPDHPPTTPRPASTPPRMDEEPTVMETLSQLRTPSPTCSI